MKKTILSVILVCVVLFAWGVSPVPAKPTLDSAIKELSVELTLGHEAYDASQPVKIRYTVTNRSDTSVYILRWATPLEGFAANLFEITQDGKKRVPYIGLLVSRIGPRPEDYVKLEANGGSASSTLDLAEGYALVSTGDYTLTYMTRILDVTLERPTFKRDHFFTAGMTRTISGTFRLSEKRKSPFAEPPLAAPARPQRLRLPAAPGEFPYFQEPSFADAKDDDDAYQRQCNCSNPGPICKFDPQDKCIEDPHPLITDADQIAALKTIYREALKKAAEAKVALNGTPYEEIARGVERYRAYFGAADGDRRDGILGTYGTIYGYGFITDVNKTVTFYQGTMCRQGWTGYVSGGEVGNDDKKRIYICPDFWTIPLFPIDFPDSQVGSVLHEMSHLAGGRGSTGGTLIELAIDDQEYNDLPCIKLAQNKPDEAVKNADNYHLFAMNRYGLTMGLDRPHMRLRLGQGTLFAKNGGGGILDACGKPDLAASGFSLSSLKENKLSFNALGAPLLITPWTPFAPADGEKVKIVTADRKHVVFAPNNFMAAGSAVPVDAQKKDSGYFTIRKAAGGTIRDGDPIALQAPNGSYLAATGSCGNGSIVSRQATAITPDMLFTAEWPAGIARHYVHLRMASGHYLSAKIAMPLRPMDVIVSTSETDSTRCPHCTFILSYPAPGFFPPRIAYPVLLTTYDGAHFLAHRSGSGAALSAVESIASPFEVLMIDHDPRKIQTGDVIALWTTGGRSFQEWRFIVEIAR